MNESTVRSKALRMGFRVCKSREQEHCNNKGEFQLVDGRNTVVAGADYDWTLADIDAFLNENAA
jgi:hypothetical protein